MTWKIPLFKIYHDDSDVQNVTDSINSAMNWAIGPNIDQFENDLAEYIGVKYATTFNSGTSALHALLLANDIGIGDEVIVPSFTFIATANSPLFVGAKPVFADIEKETFGLDPDDINEKITPHTKAIMPIHYGGCPCKIREIMEIAQDNNILIFEDAAESLGAKIGDKKIGSFGNATMLSFCQNKIITTGEGGAIVTDEKKVHERLKLIRSHGRLETSNYFLSIDPFDYVTMGFNFRMSNITAALGVTQLQKIDSIIKMRQDLAAQYTRILKDCKDKLTINKNLQNYQNVYQLFSVRATKRDQLMKHLSEKNIMTKIYFNPAHKTHFYKNVLNYSCNLPNTLQVSSEILSLPFYPTMTVSELEYVTDSIKEFYSEN